MFWSMSYKSFIESQWTAMFNRPINIHKKIFYNLKEQVILLAQVRQEYNIISS